MVVDAGGNDRDPHFLAQRLVVNHAQNDVGIFMGLFLNQGHGFLPFGQGQGLPGSGNVDQHAPGAVNTTQIGRASCRERV